ncbi:MAG: PAS domain S-box protein, partial [Bacteroidota bacterium]
MKKPRLTSSSRAQLPEFRTEHKRTEEARAESFAKLQALFDNALEAILLVDDEARYVDANPAACALLGYSREELLRMTVWDITPLPNYELGHKLWSEFIATGDQTGEYRLRRKDGTSIDAEYRAVSSIRPGLHLSILHDITERQRAQKTLEAIVLGTASTVGSEFFPSLVRNLASALDVQYALVAQLVEESHKLKTLGFWAGGEAQPNIEYLVAGTPCEKVVKKGVPCFYPSQVQKLFPGDKDLVAMNADSYLGVPLLDPAGTLLGHL